MGCGGAKEVAQPIPARNVKVEIPQVKRDPTQNEGELSKCVSSKHLLSYIPIFYVLQSLQEIRNYIRG